MMPLFVGILPSQLEKTVQSGLTNLKEHIKRPDFGSKKEKLPTPKEERICFLVTVVGSRSRILKVQKELGRREAEPQRVFLLLLSLFIRFTSESSYREF